MQLERIRGAYRSPTDWIFEISTPWLIVEI
jgi:hypothetical protein